MQPTSKVRKMNARGFAGQARKMPWLIPVVALTLIFGLLSDGRLPSVVYQARGEVAGAVSATARRMYRYDRMYSIYY